MEHRPVDRRGARRPRAPGRAQPRRIASPGHAGADRDVRRATAPRGGARGRASARCERRRAARRDGDARRLARSAARTCCSTTFRGATGRARRSRSASAERRHALEQLRQHLLQLSRPHDVGSLQLAPQLAARAAARAAPHPSLRRCPRPRRARRAPRADATPSGSSGVPSRMCSRMPRCSGS